MNEGFGGKREVNWKAIAWLFGPAIILITILAWAATSTKHADLVDAAIAGSGPEVPPDIKAMLAQPPVQPVPASDPLPPDPELEKTEKSLALFQAHRDPASPVPLVKLQGSWWSENDFNRNKVIAFVEDENHSITPYEAILSTADGTKFRVSCSARHPPKQHSMGYVQMDKCDPLPPFRWIRVAMSDIIKTQEAEQWGMTYRDSDDAQVNEFIVRGICYPNGACASFDGPDATERARERGREGR